MEIIENTENTVCNQRLMQILAITDEDYNGKLKVFHEVYADEATASSEGKSNLYSFFLEMDSEIFFYEEDDEQGYVMELESFKDLTALIEYLTDYLEENGFFAYIKYEPVEIIKTVS